jgi:hypothetical protein
MKEQWLPKWPTQPNQYRLKKFYQLDYLEDNLPYRLKIEVLDAVRQGHIVDWNHLKNLQQRRTQQHEKSNS